MSRHYDWLIVGAGFTGAVLAERIATQLDQRVLVIDRRNHIAGNAYDEVNEAGILVHKYGPHIFHTNSDKVWRYLSRFTDWRVYFHHVLGHIDGHFVPVPFNLNSISALFPAGMSDRLCDALIEKYGYGAKPTVLKMRESADGLLRFLADYVYDKVFQNYTFKQWNLMPEDLDPGVTARVPVAVSRDNRYFHDTYQAMPKEGYTVLFDRLLQHPNIDVELSTSWQDVEPTRAERTIFTGPIDEYFNYQFGALPYRSIRFAVEHVGEDRFQPVGTVNYPNEFDFTRITELKTLTGQRAMGTTLVYEFPEAYSPGANEPYYPIPTADTSDALRPYADAARSLHGKVWFAGRLGDYAYYNMDQACARALALFEKSIVPAVRP